MAHEIIQINENTWRIEDQGVRFFLLTGTEKALLIDSGMNVHNAREIAGELTTLPLELLNTHADRDHTGSNAEFSEFYMHPADEPAYRQGGGQGAVVPVGEGDILELGDRPLDIIHIPGHTPGSIAVLDLKGRFLISGDLVQDGNIFMFGPGRDLKAYADSLGRLESFADRFDEVWPSHGSFPVSPALIPQLKTAAEKILAGELTGQELDFHGMSIVRYDAGVAGFLCGK